MAATAHPALPASESAAGHPVQPGNPALRWAAQGIALWHLLSLDAPTVAMLWTWFLARTEHIRLPPAAVLAMGTAVWMLYAADRLLDSRALPSTPPVARVHSELEPRHYFHRNHRLGFRGGILLASIALALLLPRLSPQSLRLYLVLGTFLFAYFVLIHVKPRATSTNSHRLPKELAVGVFFSAAAFIPTVARDPGLRPALIPGAVLFAALCGLNCLFIYRWEHPAAPPQTHPATKRALRFLPHLALFTATAGLILALADHSLPSPIPTACALAALLLLLLHGNRHRLAPTTLRAAADLCLLTPLLLVRF